MQMKYNLRKAMMALVPCSGLDCSVADIVELVARIFNWLVGFAGIVALMFIIWASLRMFYWSLLEDSEGELSGAKRTLTRAIVGLVIIAISWLIVNTLILVMSGGTTNLKTILERVGL
jgi:hypothetical protein